MPRALRRGACAGRRRAPSRGGQVDGLLDAARAGTLREAEAQRSGQSWPNDLYAAGDERYRVLRRALAGELERDAVIAVLKDAELRGMGGAGFPTGT